jgi:IS5 family transposase
VGDNINIMLAAAAFNFKRMMNKWESSFYHFLEQVFICFYSYFSTYLKPKGAF